MMDSKTIVSIIATVAIAAALVIFAVKGDFEHSLIFGTLLVPNAAQITHKPAEDDK